jgi:hypothetical protein
MRHSLSLPHLPFDKGTVIFSPGITSALETSHSLRQVIDHFMECHLATDFGIASRAMRFDNVLASLLETGQLTSRYYLVSFSTNFIKFSFFFNLLGELYIKIYLVAFYKEITIDCI